MMQHPADVHIIPMIANLELPRRASPRTRAAVPPGYGLQEQCLPFTAATGLGLIIPAPITFGHCPAGQVPVDARVFRSPIPATPPRGGWMFYVQDDPECHFAANAYRIDMPTDGAPA